MPALNFKKQFAQLVESGEKRQTIRALRKDGRNPKKGDTLYLYTGMRTKGCRKLGEVKCKSVGQICINDSPYLDIDLASRALVSYEVEILAMADGFKTVDEMYQFFKKTHGLPFYGLLIQW